MGIPIFFGTLPAVVTGVLQERYLKEQKNMPYSNHTYDVFVMLFYSALFQLLVIILGFGLDFTPWFGYSHTIQEFAQDQWVGLQCLFHWTPTCGSSGSWPFWMFNVGYILKNTCQAVINADSATYGFMMVSTVSPISSFFWMLYFAETSMRHLWNIVSFLCIISGAIMWKFWETKEHEKQYSIEI